MSVSPKVIAAAGGAGASTVVSGVAIWAIGAFGYSVGAGADQVEAATRAVPTPLVLAIGLVLALVGAAIPGYQTTDLLRKDPSVLDVPRQGTTGDEGGTEDDAVPVLPETDLEPSAEPGEEPDPSPADDFDAVG